MTGMIRLTTLLAVIIAGVGFILYQVMKFAFAINNPASLAKRDGEKLKAIIGPHLEKLVPLSNNEMELFSLSKETRRIKKGGHTITSGVFKSIYHEPLCAFAYKEYNRKNVASLLSRTVDQEYFYISINGETRVFVDGKAYGIITGDGQLFTPNKKHLLASISPEDVLKLHPVKIGDREVGSVLNPKQTEFPNPRAFQLLDEMNNEDRTKFLALSILSLVEESIF